MPGSTQTLPDGTDVQLSDVDAGEITMRVAEAGSGPAVVLLHGFPELWWSWRHQIGPLAAAGHRVIAPDLRGYGDTDRPEDVGAYRVDHLCGDVTGLLDALGEERAVVIGHDWGSTLAWALAIREPERLRAVAGLSVPFLPRAPSPPVQLMRQFAPEDFYIVWFQEPGVADEALARDVRRTLTTGEVWGPEWAAREGDEPQRPEWMSEEELQVYVDTYERTGFTGGLNWYRNIDRSWEVNEPFADRKVEMPALFLTGSRDPVANFMPASAMEGWVTDLRGPIVIDGVGHWVQQQAPREVNEALVDWLRDVAA